MQTKELIPTNGVFVTETDYPKGYQAGSYDTCGFISESRWFPTLDKAEVYAAKLEGKLCRSNS